MCERRSVRALGRVETRERRAGHDHLALAGQVETGEQVQQRRLAGAGRAGDGGELAGAELDGEIAEDLRRARAAAVRLRRGRASARRPRAAAPGTGRGALAGAGSAGLPARRTRIPSSPESSRRARSVKEARRSSSSGTRIQPPLFTTACAAPSAPLSLLTRPSRIWTTRSATAADSGSWLTTIVVTPASRESSRIKRVDLRRVRRVELARRLVGDEEPRPVRERGADRDALLLAAGELRRERLALVEQARRARAAVGDPLALGAEAPSSPSRSPTSSRAASSGASARV